MPQVRRPLRHGRLKQFRHPDKHRTVKGCGPQVALQVGSGEIGAFLILSVGQFGVVAHPVFQIHQRQGGTAIRQPGLGSVRGERCSGAAQQGGVEALRPQVDQEQINPAGLQFFLKIPIHLVTHPHVIVQRQGQSKPARLGEKNFQPTQVGGVGKQTEPIDWSAFLLQCDRLA